jgi:hypothetical protein
MAEAYPDETPAPGRTGAVRDRLLTLWSGLIALVALPYLSLAIWLIVGGELSSRGQWPHWPHNDFAGYMPNQGWANLMALSFVCFPIPIAAFLGAIVSAGLGFLVAKRRPLVLFWVVPQTVIVVAVIGYIGWIIGRGHRLW